MNNNPTAEDSTAENLYTVQPGDTIWDIAQRHNVPLADLIGANQQIENPDLIFPGQKVTLPPAAASAELSSAIDSGYTVQPGDTLWDIAQRHNVPLADLIGANQQIENPDLIFPGQRISIPGVGGAIADTAVASGAPQSTTYQHVESTGQSATPTPTPTETPSGIASQPQQTENVTPAQPAVTETPAQEPTPAAVDVNPDNSSAANPVDTVTVTEGS